MYSSDPDAECWPKSNCLAHRFSKHSLYDLRIAERTADIVQKHGIICSYVKFRHEW